LGGVLVLASHVVDELETVVGYISLEAGRGGPLVRTAVGNAGDDGGQRNNVGGGAAEEDQRHRVGGSWLPGDGEWLAGGDNLVLG
jgi:hypothetical protein